MLLKHEARGYHRKSWCVSMQFLWPASVSAIVVVPLLLSGCTGGKALHQFVFEPAAIEPQTTRLTLEAGESLSFWNSLDVTYQTGTTLNFLISVKPEQGTAVEVLCDALKPTTQFMTTTVTSGNVVSQSWKIAKMNCSYGPVDKTQAFTITAVPQADGPVPLEADRIVMEIKG